MRKLFGSLLLGAILTTCSVIPASAQEALDGTHLFDEETRWLADNATKETRSEFDLRTKGIAQYADQKPLQVGDELTFTTMNIRESKPEKVAAVLKKIGTHCYIFVQKGKNVSNSAISRTCQAFDEKIYPTCTANFGTEWSPGIDNDPRISLLFFDVQDNYDPKAGKKGFVAGYFYAGDEYTKEQNPNSNEREMFYLDVNPGNPDKADYMSVVAHEFQHMIHWHHDAKEFTWVNESMSQLATFLNGFDHPSQVFAFIRNSDNSMLGWTDRNMLANYGQSYLFAYYVAFHYGKNEQNRQALLKTLVESNAHGTRSYLAGLKKLSVNVSFAEIFRNFCLANFINDSNIEKGIYGYDKMLGKLRLEPMRTHGIAPFAGKGSVNNWSARAIMCKIPGSEGPVKVVFKGQTQVAQNTKNEFDVAAVLYNSKGKYPTAVEWLKLAGNETSQTLKTLAGGYDTLYLVLVNRGPDESDLVENAFAKVAPAAEFGYAVTVEKAGAMNRVVASSNHRVSPRTAHSMMETIVQRADTLSEMSGLLSDNPEMNASIESPLSKELGRMDSEERLIVDSMQADLAKGSLTILQDFAAMSQAAEGNSKKNLASLENKVRDMLRFEILQNGREDLRSYLTEK